MDEGGRSPDLADVELLGLLSYLQLTAFSRLAADAEMAPGYPQRAAAARMAVGHYQCFEALTERLAALGADPPSSMRPFMAPIDAFHSRTRPNSWLQSLVKVYVGDGIAQDFYREISLYAAPGTRDLVHSVLRDTELADFAVAEVKSAIARDSAVAGPLALWGRRLVGEAFTQAQHIAAERDALASLVVSETDLGELGRMFTRITSAHEDRMARLGLSA